LLAGPHFLQGFKGEFVSLLSLASRGPLAHDPFLMPLKVLLQDHISYYCL
jgi:hypothetical protein